MDALFRHFNYLRTFAGALISVFVFGSFDVGAASRVNSDSFGAHYGYVENVKEERDKRDLPLMLLPPMPEQEPNQLSSEIVNEKLAKEFRDQYKFRFGQTAAEQRINSPGQFDDYQYFNAANVTLRQYQVFQRQFAEYMGRRLTEYHVDNWIKNDRDLRPVYALKDRVSSVNVQTKSGYKFKWKYNFSGPTMDFTFENPYKIDARVRVEMSGIVSRPDEVIYTVGYPLTKRIQVSGLHRQVDGIYQIIGTRQVTPTLGTSITGSIDTNRAGPTVQQNLLLLGLSYSH